MKKQNKKSATPKIEFSDPGLRALFDAVNGTAPNDGEPEKECEMCENCAQARDLGVNMLAAFASSIIAGQEVNAGEATFHPVAEITHPAGGSYQLVVCITNNPAEFLKGGEVYVGPFIDKNDYE